jgi:RNase P protein component
MTRTITTYVFVITQTISGLTFNQLTAHFKDVKKYPLQTEKSIKHPNEVQTVFKKTHSFCRSSFEN